MKETSTVDILVKWVKPNAPDGRTDLVSEVDSRSAKLWILLDKNIINSLLKYLRNPQPSTGISLLQMIISYTNFGIYGYRERNTLV